ncbi:MAG TPA: SDR family NAD(P)-dependent oxidoreductase, partial [Acidimicrobiales bacterium]|nr:SDR family NAD(P)-dependent oxidoreductase [Acidimicrobiales bacterium]
MRELSGRTAVVTGAASGIGLAMARRWAAEGMNVVMADIEGQALDEAAAKLAADGAAVSAVVTDVSDPASVEALAVAAEEAFGAVHVLCNNAGVGAGGPVAQLSLADWQWVLGVNLNGVVHGVTSFLPRMVAHGEDAHIVNTASMAGMVAPPMMAPYSASKFAVVALSESLRLEMKMTGTKLGVSVLCPGWVATRIHESSRNRPAALGGPPPAGGDRLSAAADFIAQGMPPDEVAAKVHDAVVDDRFYILTHPNSGDGIRRRMEAILAGDEPAY